MGNSKRKSQKFQNMILNPTAPPSYEEATGTAPMPSRQDAYNPQYQTHHAHSAIAHNSNFQPMYTQALPETIPTPSQGKKITSAQSPTNKGGKYIAIGACVVLALVGIIVFISVKAS